MNANRLYAIGCVCLLIAAAALRFYNLSDAALRFDEILAALISRDSFLEVIYNTRDIHTAPILHPLALWAVQKASSVELSVRLAAAIASVLSLAALLFVMPRVGVARWAAFLAGLLAALSPAAIEHAQDAREYSIDTLIAILMIAGLLQYLRDGRKALLCGALFAAPLLQYGLILFCAAVIGVAALAPAASQAAVRKEGLAYHRRIWERLRRRIDLALPVGAFAAACAASWELTAKYRYWGEYGGSWDSQPTKADFYYQGGYDAAAAEFAIVRTWETLTYHMPPVIAAGALLAFGGLLAASLARRRLDALAPLALLAVGIAACAALIDAYPFGGSRHGFYLGPIIFLAAGGAVHSLAADAAALARRAWVAPALTAAAAVAITVVCAAAIYQYLDYLYYSDPGVKRALAALAELEREGDAVYVSRWEVPTVEFYKWEKPANYTYGEVVCWGASWAECVPDMLDEMFRAAGDSRRIWLIHNASVSIPKEMAAHSQEAAVAAVEEIDVGGRAALSARQVERLPTPHYDRQVERSIRRSNDHSWPKPRATLHLITGFEEAAANIRRERFVEYEAAVSGAPSAAAEYNLYLQDGALYYAKRPCDAADTEAPFFLHLYPADAADLPERRRRSGFDNLDFEFQAHGLRVDDRCVIRRALPEYAIDRIHAGQFVYPDGDVVWEVELAGEP